MRIKRLMICLIMMCLIALISSSTAHADAIQLDNNTIAVPIADAREIIADNAALLAETEELRNALTSERVANAELMAKMEEYISKSDQEIKLLKEQNQILNEQVAALDKKAKTEHAKGMAQGLSLGAIIGAVLVVIL